MNNFKPVISLLVVTFVTGLLLGAISALTTPKALEQEEIARMKSLKIIFSDEEFEELETVESEHIEAVFEAKNESGIVGYVIQTKTFGYGGSIEVLTGIDMTGEIVKIQIGSHSETPGLGANASEDSFTEQYTGLSGILRVTKQKPSENEIQAITSATITTDAITDGVNIALEYFNSYLKGGN